MGRPIRKCLERPQDRNDHERGRRTPGGTQRPGRSGAHSSVGSDLVVGIAAFTGLPSGDLRHPEADDRQPPSRARPYDYVTHYATSPKIATIMKLGARNRPDHDL